MGVPGTSHSCGDGALPPTNLAYFDDMRKLHSNAIVAGVITEGERLAVVLDQTILHPQGGGQPFDTGSIEAVDGTIKFCVTDVRTKSGVVYHYGNYHENRVMEATGFEPGHEVKISVDGARRTLNSRLHSAGHLLDACMSNIGLGSLEPGKGYHFPDGYVRLEGSKSITPCSIWYEQQSHPIRKLQLCVVEDCPTILPRKAVQGLFAWVKTWGAPVEELMFLPSLKLEKSRSPKFV
ncbi:uncharacterized protein [Physcomitrium patens]|uniref:uncharacterized protein isoform X2 n=1 Tax=Physcomitrium patens TaxID=3218 RepID=UPI000D1554CE|nr:uncharacterized protein LOC112281282 isoform X2 [Physcomitrium patens]|eukprot:XP_024373397.1 uncharacterized protein LOC112281282 isoform X2 [Physcomitrella patens]